MDGRNGGRERVQDVGTTLPAPGWYLVENEEDEQGEIYFVWGAGRNDKRKEPVHVLEVRKNSAAHDV